MKTSFFPLLLAAVAANVGAAPNIVDKQSLPNVVIVYADDVGYGDVGCYGATRVKTPNIDRLAAKGLRFTQAYASSATCTPSRYSMLTGEYAWRKPGTGVLPGDAALIIQPGRFTLASVFQKIGYRTGVVGKWHLGIGPGPGKTDWNGEIQPGPLELGFDYAFLMPATGDRVPCVYVENRQVVGLDKADPIQVSYRTNFPGEPTGQANPELLKMKPSHGHDQTIVNGISRIGYMRGGKVALWKDENMADEFTRRAIAFMERERGKPFFLYFASHDIHVPRVPHPRFVGATEMGARGDAMAQLDWCVGQLMGALDRLGLTDNTIFIFTSDNGPVVDDGYRDQAHEKLGTHRPAGTLRGGKYSVFEGGTREPFILHWPAQVKAGVTDALVNQIDFIASFSSLTGQRLPPDAAPDSLDLLPAFLGKSKQGREWNLEHAGGLAMRHGRWKFIPVRQGARVNQATNTEMGNAPSVQLYDLQADPGETNNLAESQPEVVREFRERLRSLQKQPRTRPESTIPVK